MARSRRDSDSSIDVDEEGEEGEEGEEEQQVHCLFGDGVFPTLQSMLDHSLQAHQWDIPKICRQLGLDFYGVVNFVNYVRSEIRAGKTTVDIPSPEAFQDDKYLQPILADDVVLMSIDEILENGNRDGLERAPLQGTDVHDARMLQSRVAELEEDLQRAQSQFSGYRAAVKEVLDDRLEAQVASLQSLSFVDGSNEPSAEAAKKQESGTDNDASYFGSYNYAEVHEVMLKDTVRTDAYRDFIYSHPHIFRNKVVLDVGCGTGILAMMCATIGAKTVIAVDNSDILDRAAMNVVENGLDGVIKCVKGKIEEVVLPVEQVDIIISEWMGYCLLYEAMLDSVIWARDRYLAPHGLMVPSHITLHLAPICDPAYIAAHIHFWREVYEFSMSSMMLDICDDVQVQHLTASHVQCVKPACILTLNLHTVDLAALTFTREFSVTLQYDVNPLDGWAIWFDVFFLPDRSVPLAPDIQTVAEFRARRPVSTAFSTGPYGPETHWQQGELLINGEHRPLRAKRGQVLAGQISYRRPKPDSRELVIEMEWGVVVDPEPKPEPKPEPESEPAAGPGPGDDTSAAAGSMPPMLKRRRKQRWYMR
ncbi:MAG: hypothetical protein M1826_004471 [Phylliscum demangeonii]|nr:MAG: hypothetical protein M1826_004471 [Phylliscum demangeonii]